MNDGDAPVVSTITLRHHPADARLTVWANWPYDVLFGELVKSEIPKGERRFDPGELGRPKGWWFHPSQLDRITELLHEKFGRVRLETEDGSMEIGEGGEVLEEEQARLI